MKNKTYVISLIDATKRRVHIEQVFSSLNINYQFFDAIDRKTALDTCSDNGLDFKKDSLTLGELGCFMSHYSLWKKIIDDDLPYMLIFEDDVIVSPKIIQFIENIDVVIQELGAVRLETMLTCTVYSKERTEIMGFDFLRMKTEHMGLAGYVISQNIAKKLIEIIQQDGISKPIDHYLCLDFVEKREDVDLYQITPALVIQEDVLHKGANSSLHSSLELERRAAILKENKLIKEFRRLISQLNPDYWRRRKRKKYIRKEATITPFDNN